MGSVRAQTACQLLILSKAGANSSSSSPPPLLLLSVSVSFSLSLPSVSFAPHSLSDLSARSADCHRVVKKFPRLEKEFMLFAKERLKSSVSSGNVRPPRWMARVRVSVSVSAHCDCPSAGIMVGDGLLRRILSLLSSPAGAGVHAAGVDDVADGPPEAPGAVAPHPLDDAAPLRHRPRRPPRRVPLRAVSSSRT